MLIKKDFRYLEWVYKAWTKRNRMPLILLKTGSKKEGENVGRSNITAITASTRGALSHTTRQQGLKTFKDVKGEKK